MNSFCERKDIVRNKKSRKNAKEARNRFKRGNLMAKYPMADECCKKEQRKNCCVQCPREITESRGFQNYLKCLMEKNPGMCKCDAIKQAKAAYKCFKEHQKCKYRYMGCSCPDECEKCDKPNCGGVLICMTREGPEGKKKCVKCPCDAPRPCPCKFKPPNPCARGRNCDADVVGDELNVPEIPDLSIQTELSPQDELQNMVCSPIFCQDCGGAFLGDGHDELGCGPVDPITPTNVFVGVQHTLVDKSLGFRNFFKMYQNKYQMFSKAAAMNNAAQVYNNFTEDEKDNFRGMGFNPHICHKQNRLDA